MFGVFLYAPLHIFVSDMLFSFKAAAIRVQCELSPQFSTCFVALQPLCTHTFARYVVLSYIYSFAFNNGSVA